MDGGRFTWAAGPLTKGSNLCHGTGGNGYAFLKLYRRTNDPGLARPRTPIRHDGHCPISRRQGRR
ncbi:lanthionine synthetase LanC family protein [Bradyrhizobium sp. CB82]|uniref:lanthionine synthetase LanC family protein n=1 Tax=Bradyrhizobium sp. CB82 TaxID=3039159 RepID=UPI0024B0CE38|nr:lanthionine synthetase LanC family protein [Bradyrhizobium sp. CB82]WFU43082.1 lanthionine synthetase LanC family protein [Bradyrhizobium sp. CB82]